MQHKPKRSRAIALPRAEFRARATEYLDFLAAWVQKPRQTASVVPSSRYLARLMVAQIDPTDGRVLELGGGTGVFTRAILGTGLPPEKLEVVEINPAFARGLRRHFPNVSVLETPAQIVSTAAAGEPGTYQTVVSGLPLLAMDRHVHYDILSESFRMLQPGGSFVQFTYSMRPPVSRDVIDALDLDVERAGQTVRNFPPATVFRFTRRDA
ncbi:MAG: methyltransferase domain-containing protein [Sphingobium sp.]|uniref:class I SAM-dependent methyltransferase n=1 Tax=Sphingobium TaxID=165695 RepID=UPI000379447D|nr:MULTISPECIES: methyltransferase domain-containing protein [Sphingobium]MBU0660316.1 methyltransferase domain-containing protein [Alphaproteobacteria bacterium]MBA4753706.1 methyltransferase domain-containing protein [Sphingobium sp.]MBG6119631.1 phospholipid N-methyltransferase [Sphingobium sp. JAI105]MBS86893.1 methyltransferase domain-containing protein [Sphingobium sp.]MBU0774447.1 methyltransferase domain-containing protein [Alphaproteobacteria bacterium]